MNNNNYKAKRNKAYKDSNRSLICTYEGVEYYTNTYIAEIDTSIPTVNKSVPFIESKPSLEGVLRVETDYYQTEVTSTSEGYTTLGSTYPAKVNSDFLEYLQHRYPSATIHRTDDHLAPIKLMQDNKLMAVIMPLRR